MWHGLYVYKSIPYICHQVLCFKATHYSDKEMKDSKSEWCVAKPWSLHMKIICQNHIDI